MPLRAGDRPHPARQPKALALRLLHVVSLKPSPRRERPLLGAPQPPQLAVTGDIGSPPRRGLQHDRPTDFLQFASVQNDRARNLDAGADRYLADRRLHSFKASCRAGQAASGDAAKGKAIFQSNNPSAQAGVATTLALAAAEVTTKRQLRSLKPRAASRLGRETRPQFGTATFPNDKCQVDGPSRTKAVGNFLPLFIAQSYIIAVR